MMHGLAFGLVLTSLLTVGFFTPADHNFKPETNDDDVIVKEGHRAVVVEYQKDDGNTKVSISPHEPISDNKFHDKAQDTREKVTDKAREARDKLTDKAEDVKEKLRETSASALPKTEKIADDEDQIRSKFSPTKLVCDAAGKCRRVIASAVGKTKDAAHGAAETAYEAEEALSDAAGKVSGKVQEATESAKDTVVGASGKAKDKMTETAGETFGRVKDTVSGASGKAKDKLTETTDEALGSVKDTVAGASGKLNEKTGRVKEGVEEMAGMAKSAEQKLGMKDRLQSAAVTAGGVGQLMGFAAAYGMSVWVTFASSYVLAGALPRQQFSVVQSRIYPVYFRAMAYCLGMALLGHLMRNGSAGVGSLQTLNLAAALAMDLVNLVYLEPRATKVMVQRLKKEKEEGNQGKEGRILSGDKESTAAERRIFTGERRFSGDKESTAEIAGRGGGRGDAEIMGLSARLQKLNSYSSMLNVMTLMSLTWHLVHLGQCLH